MKRPIIHLPNVEVQRALYDELMARGHAAPWGGWSLHNPVHYPYVSVIANDQIAFQHEYIPDYAVMNSPRQFLAYLSRMPK